MDADKIVYLEKPDCISWEQVSDVLVRSHAKNREQGIVLPFPHLPPTELKKKVEGKEGKLFVAMHDDKLVGTAAVLFIKKNLWCGKGPYAYCCLASVLPEYSGMGIYRNLLEIEDSFALSKGYTRMMFDSDENNKHIFDVSFKNGYKFVEYRVRETHRSIVMVKWLDRAPYPNFVFSIVYAMIKRYRILKSSIVYHR